MTKPV